MKRKFNRKNSILRPLFCAAIMIAAASSPAYAGPSPDRASPNLGLDKLDHFPLKSGLCWKYKSNLGETIVRVTKEGEKYILVFQAPHVRLEQRLALTEDGVVLLGGKSKIYFFSNQRTYQPPLVRLPLPPRVGRTWFWEGTELVDDEVLHSRIEGTIVGEEKVEVPAGEFDCLKVEIETTSDDGTLTSSTQWIASGVGVVKAFIEIDPGGLTGIITWLLGLDTFTLELEEMSEESIPPDL